MGARSRKEVIASAIVGAARRGARRVRAEGISAVDTPDPAEREKVYGPSPTPRGPFRRLSPEERAALMPWILELRDRGLTWPQVAAELKIRTSQAEMAYKEWKAAGRCHCGQPGTLRPDPYQLRVHGERIDVFLCDECEEER